MRQDDILDLFHAAGVGAVSVRRMFGGLGVYHDGDIVALVVSGELRLKADAVSAPRFEAAGAARWSYERPDGRVVDMPYWSPPDEAWDDPERMAEWIALACEAGRRSRAAQTATRPRRARR